jgi:nucleolin
MVYLTLIYISSDRPLKIYYCPPRPGDVWPPLDGRVGMTAPPRATKSISEKPEGCRKIFVGNLSYNIDDDTLVDFFKDCGTMTGLRWLTHKDSGDFKVLLVFFNTYYAI